VTLQQLRYFIALYEEGTFTRAARRCCISQPSLSEAIRALETELGGALFSRKLRRGPTELGKLLYPLILSAMGKLDAAVHVAVSQQARSIKRKVRAPRNRFPVSDRAAAPNAAVDA